MTVILTNVVYFGVKSPQDVVTVRRIVCTESVIRDYNTVSARAGTSIEEIKKIASQRVESAKKVAELPNMKQDPTCLYIASEWAIQTGKVTEAKEYISLIKSFADKGVFSDTSVYGITSLSILDSRVARLVQFGPDKNEGVNSGVQTLKQ